MCNTTEETIALTASDSSKEYKTTRGDMIKLLELCTGVSVTSTAVYSQQWYQHTAEPVIDKENVKNLCDVNIKTDHIIEHR